MLFRIMCAYDPHNRAGLSVDELAKERAAIKVDMDRIAKKRGYSVRELFGSADTNRRSAGRTCLGRPGHLHDRGAALRVAAERFAQKSPRKSGG